MIRVKDISDFLETIAPLAYQESYDNSGLLTGNPDAEVKGVLVCLDSTEEVIHEAVKKGCNLVVAHHPIVFSGLKKLTGRNYVERTLLAAIRNNVSIYAIHTNLDNINAGVNRMIGERMGLQNLRILSPKSAVLRKLVTFCPTGELEKVRRALFEAGAGNLGNYSECSFVSSGEGTFKGNELAQPAIGEKGIRHTEKETRLEVIYENHRQNALLKALFASHPYEEVAYDIFELENAHRGVGSGMLGETSENRSEIDFMKYLKAQMRVSMIRHTRFLGKPVRRIAICGGSGSFLLPQAISAGADVFITSDFKYHQFFDSEDKIVIADIGHYESEQFTMDLIKSLIIGKFSTFAVQLTEVNTNPVHYL